MIAAGDGDNRRRSGWTRVLLGGKGGSSASNGDVTGPDEYNTGGETTTHIPTVMARENLRYAGLQTIETLQSTKTRILCRSRRQAGTRSLSELKAWAHACGTL